MIWLMSIYLPIYIPNKEVIIFSKKSYDDKLWAYFELHKQLCLSGWLLYHTRKSPNLFAWLSLNKEIALLLYSAIVLQIKKFIADVVVHTKAMSTSVPLSRRQCRPCTEESPLHQDIYFLMFLVNFPIVIMTRNKIFRFLEIFRFLVNNSR